MKSPHRRQAAESTPMLRYVLWFLAAYFVANFCAGVLQFILPNIKALKFVISLAAVFVAADFTRWRFTTDHGRGMASDERMRLFLGSLLVGAVLVLLATAVMIKVANSRPFSFRKIPMSIALLGAIGVPILYSPILWFSYWWRNARSAGSESAPTPMLQPRVKVLVVGGGGREHALAWKLAQSRRVSEVIVAPGNAGTAREPKCRNAAVAITDITGLLALAQSENVALTVVGPETPLVAGICDTFRNAGLRIFGPTAKAAQLEGSKAFAKEFLARHGIPTAEFAVFTDVDAALSHVRDKGAPIVVKADGLAAGKGVIVAMTLAEAEAAIVDMLSGNTFGSAGARVVIEEFLDGEEASFITMVDGHTALPMATSQDHKRVGDGDTGPNTGGMGAYSPAPVVTPDVHERILRDVIRPTIEGMKRDGNPFTGFLYAGLMINAHGAPKVIEFNVRFGDPETQPVMMRLQSDLLDLFDAALERQLHATDARWDTRRSLGVVMAAANYPDAPRTGDVIHGLDVRTGTAGKVFHAGTQLVNGEAVTSGGRVLCVCALGNTVGEAQLAAYEAVDAIGWHGEFHRHDIGWRAIARERGGGAAV